MADAEDRSWNDGRDYRPQLVRLSPSCRCRKCATATSALEPGRRTVAFSTAEQLPECRCAHHGDPQHGVPRVLRLLAVPLGIAAIILGSKDADRHSLRAQGPEMATTGMLLGLVAGAARGGHRRLVRARDRSRILRLCQPSPDAGRTQLRNAANHPSQIRRSGLLAH